MSKEIPLNEMIAQFAARGMRFWPGEDLVEWAGERWVHLRSAQTAEERLFDDVDAVVTAVGSVAVAHLARTLRGLVPELHVIGDANTPQTVELATYQGARIGREL